MKLRVARHTTDLAPIRHFYENIIGLEVIGEFTAHDGYDGLFLAPKEKAGWHLEFTASADLPDHHPDEEDLLVFYLNKEEFARVQAAMKANKLEPVPAKNSYWQVHGVGYLDPDGYGVMLVAI